VSREGVGRWVWVEDRSDMIEVLSRVTAHQRFFRHLTLSFKTPAVVNMVREALAGQPPDAITHSGRPSLRPPWCGVVYRR
jgi:hypothetical protein